jgi:dihydrolipoamide dehydrogenase
MMVASTILGNLSLAKTMGVSVNGISANYTALVKRQDELITFMREGVRSTAKKKGVELIEGRGRLAGRGKVALDDTTLHFKNIILATGAHWVQPDFPGADLEEVSTTDYLLTAEVLPQRVLLYGRSPWLIEIAQFLRRFDCVATLVTPDQRILSDESKTITARLTKVLRNEGITIATGGQITAINKESDGLHVELNSKAGGEMLAVDRVITLERRAAIKELGLNTIGLEEGQPYLTVNEKMETGVEGVYAIGDLTGPPSLHYSHRAAAMGLVAAENAMGNNASLNPQTIPRILFTQPQIACVGITAKQAKEAGHDVLVGSAPYSMNPFGMLISENEGIVEIVTDREYGELLGAHFIGTAAAEMVGQAILVMQMEAPFEWLSEAPFPHPTLSESLAEAARDALERAIYLP